MKGHLGFVRFHDMDRAYINRDYQIHTQWTDGQHTPQEIIQAAKAMGLGRIAFTEHIRRESDYFPRFFAEIDQLRSQTPLEVLIGVETKVVDVKGNLDISSADYDLAEIILGSVHRIPYQGALTHPRDLGKATTLVEEFKHSMAMVEAGVIDVLAHPLGMSLRIYQDFSREDLEALIKRIAKTEIAFELNAKYTNPLFLNTVVELCKVYNPYVSVGSDVHQLSQLGDSKRMLEKIL